MEKLRAVNRTRTVLTTATPLLGENARRVWAALVNQGVSDVWLSLGGTAALNTFLYLKANGGSFLIDMANPWPGAVSGIASADSIVTAFEVETY